jgi:hypothetical protein
MIPIFGRFAFGLLRALTSFIKRIVQRIVHHVHHVHHVLRQGHLFLSCIMVSGDKLRYGTCRYTRMRYGIINMYD